MIEIDRQLSVKMITEETGLDKNAVHRIPINENNIVKWISGFEQLEFTDPIVEAVNQDETGNIDNETNCLVPEKNSPFRWT